MFSTCESMKWAHLPVAGGLYDQHPRLLEGFRTILQARGLKESKKHEEAERKRRFEEGKRPVAGRRHR